jgi:hypothetical protein
LEKHLEPEFVKCKNEKYEHKLFKWSLDSHSKDCLYSMTKCFLCDEIIKQDNIKEHLKTNCGNKIEWMEINEIENSGSLGLVEFVRHSSGKSVEVKLKDLKSNFALIIKDFIVMALRCESDWTIGCVDSNNTYELDMYYKPYKSGYYQIQNTIILKSVKTLKELPSNDNLPKIPIDITTVEFLPQKSDSLSVNTDTFFEQLLE